MFKVIALLKAKSGMTREQFIEYYETSHAPLVKRLTPLIIIDYRRNYVDLAGAFIFEGTSAPDFDAITEFWYSDRAAYDAMMALHAQPEIARQIIEDEKNFLDRSKTRMFVVEEHRQDAP